ncbi:MAG: hypothetical protein KDA75_23570, partial [Planctomycetaceae bacterium]|nr:hypothetical protein [Planctomycetaceae bacterium]
SCRSNAANPKLAFLQLPFGDVQPPTPSWLTAFLGQELSTPLEETTFNPNKVMCLYPRKTACHI